MVNVYKSIELVGTSEEGWTDAARNAFAEAKKTLRGIRNITILQADVKIQEDKDQMIFRIRCQITFEIEK